MSEIVGIETHPYVGDGDRCAGILGYVLGDERHGEVCGLPRYAYRHPHPSKVRPGRVTDAMVEAFRREAGYDTGADRAERHRDGLVAALKQREIERRADPRTMDREQRIAERTRDLLDEIVSVELHPINLDPYPGTVGEVADEIARYILELEGSGVARGLVPEVLARLSVEDTVKARERAVQDAAQVLATVTACACQGISHRTECPQWVLPI